MNVRTANSADIPGIVSLLGELLESVEERKGLSSSAFKENLASIMRKRSNRLLVAVDGSKIAGFLNLHVRSTCIHVGKSGLFDELIVGKGYRHSGVAGLLVEAAVDTCRRLGCSEVEVSTESANKRALAFYESKGFERRGLLLELEL
jgi:ribosomal protein S18 acetylase RimI-like enzyme